MINPRGHRQEPIIATSDKDNARNGQTQSVAPGHNQDPEPEEAELVHRSDRACQAKLDDVHEGVDEPKDRSQEARRRNKGPIRAEHLLAVAALAPTGKGRRRTGP